MYSRVIKLVLDCLLALVALICLSPFFLILILTLSFNNKGKVFFIQERIGLHSRAFKILKFKTMSDERNKLGELLPDHERITRLGKIVRQTSMDELPQLFNVLTGQMSLVGPRPLLKKYLPLYTEQQSRRHTVRPGITGWAQVNGRNAISWKKKFELDVWYVDHLSFLLDMKIIYYTIKKVFIREGVNAGDTTTMEAFNGKN